MRVVFLVCVLVSCVAAGQGAPVQEPAGSQVLAAARAALGGSALDRLRDVRIQGRGSRDLGPVAMAGPIELRIALPDRYVRLDRLTLGGLSSVVVTGFDGDTLIQRALVAGAPSIDPVAQLPDETRVTALASVTRLAKRDAALLLLGFLASSLEIYPLAFADAGLAEAPDGTADVVDATGPDGFSARLFVDTRTRLPLMVSWSGIDLPGMFRMVLPGAGNTPPAVPRPDQVMALAESFVEHRLYFGDYRSVGAVRWPFRIRRSVGGVIVEELTVDTITLDPDFAPDAFDPRP